MKLTSGPIAIPQNSMTHSHSTLLKTHLSSVGEFDPVMIHAPGWLLENVAWWTSLTPITLFTFI